MAASTTGLMTTEQFLALPDEFDASGNRIKQELIAGEIVCVSFASSRHDIIKNQIGESLNVFLAGSPNLGLKALIEIGFSVSGADACQPDVCVIGKTRLRESASRVLTGAPEIAIEVVSPTDTAVHLRRKIDAYLTNGSRSVWVVYPEARLIEIHTRDGVREFTGDQQIQDGVLPGFSQPAESFFEGL
jgi:Uma2 family endonuclease